jgi:Lon-like ATP-dependent protease
VKPVGGIVPKVQAAAQAGAKRVLIPQENHQDLFAHLEGVTVEPVQHIRQVIEEAVIGNPFAGQRWSEVEVAASAPIPPPSASATLSC